MENDIVGFCRKIMAMFAACRSSGFLKSFFPVPAGLITKTSGTNGTLFAKNAVVIRACSGSVLQRIEKKKEEAIVGGGQKRIDTQHRKVRTLLEIFIFPLS